MYYACRPKDWNVQGTSQRCEHCGRGHIRPMSPLSCIFISCHCAERLLFLLLFIWHNGSVGSRIWFKTYLVIYTLLSVCIIQLLDLDVGWMQPHGSRINWVQPYNWKAHDAFYLYSMLGTNSLLMTPKEQRLLTKLTHDILLWGENIGLIRWVS